MAVMIEDEFETDERTTTPTAAKEKERTAPLIDWTTDFEGHLLYQVAAGTVLTDFPDLLDPQLFGGGDNAPQGSPLGTARRSLAEIAIEYHRKHKASPGPEVVNLIRAAKKHKVTIPMIEAQWEKIVQHEAEEPTDYESMKVHLGARCLYRASRQKVVEEAEWLSQGKFETIEEFAKAQEIFNERIQRIERAGSIKVPFKLARASEFKAAPVSFLIEGLIPDGMLSMVAGKDGLGKSLLTMEMMRSVLTSRAFLGKFKVVRTGQVLYLAMDDPDSLVEERLVKMGLKDKPGLYVPQDIDYEDPIRLLRHVLKICDEGLDGFKPSLIVVDCLYRLLPKEAGALKDANAMIPLLNLLNTVAEKTQTAVIVVHHETKATGEIAGSFAIRASLKTLIHITKPKPAKDEVPDESLRLMTMAKSKMLPEDSWPLRLKGPGDWDLVESEEIVNLMQTKILKVVQDHERGISHDAVKSVLGAFGRVSTKVEETIAEMVQNKILEVKLGKVDNNHGVKVEKRLLFEYGKGPDFVPPKVRLNQFYEKREGGAQQIAPDE